MQRLNVTIHGRMIPELRVNGARLYLDPIKEPDLDPDEIDERERVKLPPRRYHYHRHSLTRWNV